jgi:hypothetical protein
LDETRAVGKFAKSLPDLMGRKKVGPAEIDTGLLSGSWRRLAPAAPHLEPGTVDWKADVFCVLGSPSTGCCAGGRCSRVTRPARRLSAGFSGRKLIFVSVR